MIKNNARLIIYLNTSVNSVFKILPLYEEENVGVEVYIKSLLFELYGLDTVIEIVYSYEYLSLLSTLESVKAEVSKIDCEKSTIKREVFKCINIIKNLVTKIEGI